MIRVVVFLCLWVLSLNAFSALTEKNEINVVFVTPDKQGNNFWDLVKSITDSAADSLKIDVETYYVDNDRFAQQNAIFELMQRKIKPGYVIFRGYYGQTEKMFGALELAKIPFITLEQAMSKKELLIVGKPQEKYKYWLGEVVYDNKAGGELLLTALIAKHKKLYPNKVMYITGIGGDFEEVALDRQLALEKILLSEPAKGIVVNQIFTMNWESRLVKERFDAITKRYPNTTAYWCAGDQMALTVLAEHQGVSKKPLIIGGFDWTPMALKKIKMGEMTASVGGHVLMAAAALVKIHDYHFGIKHFNSSNSLNKFELITQNNVDKYLTFIENEQWQNIDFLRFTHTATPNPPELSFENMIKIYNESEAK